MNLLSSLLKWGVRNGYVERNNAEGLQVKLDKPADEQRKIFEPNDLKRITNNLPKNDRCPWMFWIPMIAMYSGLRREEICQLRKVDVVQVDEVWCFKIVGDSQAGLTVKTASSSRIVPVHLKLIELGLLEHVQLQQPKDNLWGFKRYKNQSEYGKKFGNWFSTFNREFVTQDPLKCFHSFRHTVANTLKQSGVQEGLIAELLGHKNNSITTGRYGKKYKVRVLLDSIGYL
jgi:integrase